MVAPRDLATALGLGDHEMVSLVGGGGKTTALLALGRTLPGRILVTTTTRMGESQTAGWPTLTAPSDGDVSAALVDHGVAFVRRGLEGGKSLGVEPAECDRWLDRADHVIVEADGAAMRPFTAPRPHEPVVPARTTTLVACIGADALGRVIADQCHNPMRVAAVAGCSPYQRLTPERAARVLLDERGSRKGCPSAARFAVVVTKVTDPARPLVEDLVDAIGSGTTVVLVAFDPDPALGYPARS